MKEKEQRDKTAEQITKERLQAMREADKIFSEKEKLKAQKIKDDGSKLKDFNAAQMVMLKIMSHQLQVLVLYSYTYGSTDSFLTPVLYFSNTD